MKTSIPALTPLLFALVLAATLTACKEEPPAAVAVAAAPRKCDNCGTISGIEQMKQKGKGTGLGIVAGAVLGAVVGHQIGDGRGQDAATVVGAVGGGFAGNEIEKQIKSDTYYHVTVLMESGGTRAIDVAVLNGLSTGQKVRVVGNNLEMRGA